MPIKPLTLLQLTAITVVRIPTSTSDKKAVARKKRVADRRLIAARMEHQGQHGHATNQANEYGNQVAAGHGTTGVGAAGEQVQPMRDDHKTDGLLRRSSSSSSSSSEDDGKGGRRKKGIKEKIKEKLPGGNKDSTGQQHTTTGGATGTGAHGTEGTGEKKGLMGKIKEKLPGQH